MHKSENDRLQKICDVLKKETLEPAQRKAEEIVVEAEKKAEEIIATARRQADQIELEAKNRIEQERKITQAALQHAGRQSLETLRQEIEQNLFNSTLADIVADETNKPQVIVKLIEAIVGAIQKNGLTQDLDVIVPDAVTPSEINSILMQHISDNLRNKSVSIGNINGGVQVKMREKQMTIDISDRALVDYLQRYLRKDFRQRLFGLGQ